VAEHEAHDVDRPRAERRPHRKRARSLRHGLRQIALFVAPALVIAGHLMGQPLGLEFTILEVSAVMLSVIAVSNLVLDGRTIWFEGVQLLAIYAILAMTFFFI